MKLDMIDMVRKYIWVVLAIAVLVLSVLFYRACQIDDPYKALYDDLKVKYDVLESESLADIADLQSAISDRDKEIEELTSEIRAKTEVMESRNIKIGELESRLASIDPSDKDAIIANLTEQVSQWKAQFNLAQKIISDKDEIIFNLSEKYEAQLKVSNNYKALWEGEKELHGVALKRIKVLEGQLRGSRISGTIKNIVAIGLGGIIIYGLATK